ncbi:restriction endonuclease subunit S [Acinetobacter lwoffii]|uniref:Restriction endonuclease subunit S n=1 Tax=Acinetobacter lwoffii TaxID=28090 RepID=A0A6N1MTL4_ACILW|nr:restriction endonuclease subunit S [Acinetobacter lwoffii]QKU21232.1 restriction endonuclease subunit S [Acinetobacter lwoffii]
MAKYQKYAEYKDSGFEWADKLPVHWNSVHLKWISTIYAGGTPSKTIESYWENGTIPWINSGAVNQTYILEPSTYITKAAYENSSAKWIPKKALVMALAGQGKTKGMVAQLGIDTTCNQSMGAIIPNDLDYARYLFWWITSNYQNIRNMAGGDLRDGLNLEHLGDMHCPLPNKDEVQKIANFLDYETAKIDSLIAKQEKLIELLKEKRQAVISHAVTKGLNPDVKLKDSGVEWLGQVPEHWVIIKGGYIGTLFGSESVAEEDIVDDGVLPFIKVSSLSVETFKLNSIDWFVTEKRAKFCKAEKNYIVFPKRGAAIFTNKVNVVEIDSVIDPNLMGWKIGKKGLTEYFALLLKTRGLDDIADVSTVPQINNKHIAPEKFPLPPVKEQSEIITFVGLQLENFENLINAANSAIRLMQERRTALISSAVTGKIDVRNWQHPNEAKTGLSS